MYAQPVQTVAPATKATRALPIAAICCLGLIGFLIATTIVLALIPLYLPNKQVTVNNIRTSIYLWLTST